MKVPVDMQAELGEWNNGRGISLDAWITCTGNMKLAVGYSEVFWPRFKILNDYIVREDTSVDSMRAFLEQCGNDHRGIEATLNHLHIADIQSYGDKESTVERIEYLIPILKEIYSAKLAWQFPERPCTVDVYKPANPADKQEYQITFWQKKYE